MADKHNFTDKEVDDYKKDIRVPLGKRRGVLGPALIFVVFVMAILSISWIGYDTGWNQRSNTVPYTDEVDFDLVEGVVEITHKINGEWYEIKVLFNENLEERMSLRDLNELGYVVENHMVKAVSCEK